MARAAIELRDLAKQTRRALVRRRLEADLVTDQLRAAQASHRNALERLEKLSQVKALFEAAGTAATDTARAQTEDLVTQALQFVYGDRCRFQVEMGTQRGRPDATFKVETVDGPLSYIGEPIDSGGGGVVDVLSVALRVVLMEGLQPQMDGPLLLDEPGKQLSAEYSPRLAEFLVTVCREFGRQVLMVTHNTDLAGAADLGLHVRLETGVSVVRT